MAQPLLLAYAPNQNAHQSLLRVFLQSCRLPVTLQAHEHIKLLQADAKQLTAMQLRQQCRQVGVQAHAETHQVTFRAAPESPSTFPEALLTCSFAKLSSASHAPDACPDAPMHAVVETLLMIFRSAQGFDTVMSDMCPDTSGVAAADVARSLELASHAARLALSNSSELPVSGRDQSKDGELLHVLINMMRHSITCWQSHRHPEWSSQVADCHADCVHASRTSNSDLHHLGCEQVKTLREDALKAHCGQRGVSCSSCCQALGVKS